MKKNAVVLLHDYWHPAHTIEPLLPLIFDEKEWFVKVTDDPNYIGAMFDPPHLVINFKDGVANTSIPTTNWYTNDTWPPYLSKLMAMAGTGYIGVHCGLANIPEDCVIYTDLLKGRFLNHPPKCPVKVEITAGHPVTEGVNSFEIDDEHYQMEGMWDEVNVLGTTTSQHGTQVGIWAHEVGACRVVGITPGHTTEVLTHPEMVKLLKNAIVWASARGAEEIAFEDKE